ncbi:MAG: 50S ribosomal protein L1 [Promethearchaeota archaeon]
MIVTDENLKNAIQKAIENSVWKKEGKKDKVRKFDESLDLIVNLRDVDVRNPNNRINQEFILPYPIKKDKLNVCFITDGDQLLDVKKLGYDYLDKNGLEDMKKKKNPKLLKNFVKKYDDFIVRADMMRDVAKILGRFLGQSGKMPKPQPKGNGIVKPDQKVEQIIENFRRRVKINMKKAPLIQTIFGKKSMEVDKSFENLKVLLGHIENFLPNGMGNIRSIYMKTTMGKVVKVAEPVSSKGKRGGKKRK